MNAPVRHFVLFWHLIWCMNSLVGQIEKESLLQIMSLDQFLGLAREEVPVDNNTVLDA